MPFDPYFTSGFKKSRRGRRPYRIGRPSDAAEVRMKEEDYGTKSCIPNQIGYYRDMTKYDVCPICGSSGLDQGVRVCECSEAEMQAWLDWQDFEKCFAERLHWDNETIKSLKSTFVAFRMRPKLASITLCKSDIDREMAERLTDLSNGRRYSLYDKLGNMPQWAEGAAAASSGMLESFNPYNVGSAEFKSWRLGWNEANESL